MNTPDPRATTVDLRRSCLELRRSDFSWTSDTTYFNNAGIGPLPERTKVVAEELIKEKVAPHNIDVPGLFDRLAETRSTLSRLINAEVAEIGLTTSTTLGLNVAAQALPLEGGETILLSEREFPANVYPWLQLESRGVNVELAPPTTDGWPDERYLCDRVSDPKVRVLAISLVQFASGYRADVARLSDACRANDCYLVVDGIQGIGQTDFDVKATPVDLMACGGQKWMLSPFGSGFLYVRSALLEQLQPTFVGWLAFDGSDDYERLTEYEYRLRSDARRFEINTLPFQDLIAMNESGKLLLSQGVANIAEWLREVLQPLHYAAAHGKIRVVSPTEELHTTGIVCVAPTKLRECYQRLRDAGVIVAIREGALRLSPHCYNTPGEMEKAVAVLTEFG